MHVVGRKAGPGCSKRASSALGTFPFLFVAGKASSFELSWLHPQQHQGKSCRQQDEAAGEGREALARLGCCF